MSSLGCEVARFESPPRPQVSQAVVEATVGRLKLAAARPFEFGRLLHMRCSGKRQLMSFFRKRRYACVYMRACVQERAKGCKQVGGGEVVWGAYGRVLLPGEQCPQTVFILSSVPGSERLHLLCGAASWRYVR